MHIPKIHPHTGYSHIPASAVVRGGKGVAQYSHYKSSSEQQTDGYHQQPRTETDWGAVILIVIITVVIAGWFVSMVVAIINKIRYLFSSIKRSHVMTDKELEKLMKLVVLRNNGALTEAEFERERQKITRER